MRSFLISTILILISSSCKPQPEAKSSPVGYNLQQPEKISLSESLLEVSGIAFRNGDPDTVFAVQDEDGRVFSIAMDSKEQKSSSFQSGGDYEDLTIMNDRMFVLKSNSSIYSFPLAAISGKKVPEVAEYKKLLPSGEYEGMYYDSLTNKIIVMCKSCKDDKKAESLTGYTLQVDGDRLILDEAFKLNYKSAQVKGKLKPSALARHPLTKQWYIISSVNRSLLILDDEWQIREVHPLSSKIFNQPEGIAFDKQGNLYISNEGDELTQGNILKFIYRSR